MLDAYNLWLSRICGACAIGFQLVFLGRCYAIGGLQAVEASLMLCIINMYLGYLARGWIEQRAKRNDRSDES